MKYIVSGAQAKEIDRYTIEEMGIPSMVLMERAALAVVETMKEFLRKDSRVLRITSNHFNSESFQVISPLIDQMPVWT